MGKYHLLPYLENAENQPHGTILQNSQVWWEAQFTSERVADYAVSEDISNLLKGFAYVDNEGYYHSCLASKYYGGCIWAVHYINYSFNEKYKNNPTTILDNDTGLYYFDYKHTGNVRNWVYPELFDSLREGLDACNDGLGWNLRQSIPVVYTLGGGYTHNFLRYHSIVKLKMNHLLTREEVA